MKKTSLKKRIIILLISIAIIIGLLGLYFLVFLNYGIVIPCIFRKITGFYCPGCGITRMISSLIQLDFYQAFRYNPLLFIAFPFIMFCLLETVIKWLLGKKDYFYQKLDNKIWTVLLIITLLFGVVRNIPFFEYLIPTMI